MAIVATLCFALLGTSFAFPSPLSKRDRPSTMYTFLTCTPEIEDSSINDKTRWEAAQATQAMADWDYQWNTNRDEVDGVDEHQPYFNAMLNRFGFDEQKCGLTTDSCDFSTKTCNEFKYPAHFLIAHSLLNLHSFWLTYYNALMDARGGLDLKMASFVEKYAPGKPDSDLISVMTSNFQSFAFDMLLEASMGPLGKVLTETHNMSEDIADKIISSGKDMLSAAKAQAVGEGALGSELAPEQKRATLSETLYDMTDSITTNILGTTTTISKLTLEFGFGAWLSYAGLEADGFKVQQNLQKAFSALLVPSAWRLANRETYGIPIILVKNSPCFQGNPSPCFQDDAIAGGSCAVEGKTLYLVGYTGAQSRDAQGYPIYGCPHNTFVKLLGMDELNNNHDPDLTKDVLIRSVWDAYVVAGSKNGYGAELTIDGAGGSIIKPGLLQIPICDLDEAIKAHMNDARVHLCDYGNW